MLDFVKRNSDLGTTGALTRKERKRHGQTIVVMRCNLTDRAQETLEALSKHSGGTLKAPMARSIRNGIAVKIGYGRRNVGFFEGEDVTRTEIIPELHFPHDRKFAAVQYIQDAIAAVNAGEFDALLEAQLTKLKKRFEATDGSAEEDGYSGPKVVAEAA